MSFRRQTFPSQPRNFWLLDCKISNVLAERKHLVLVFQHGASVCGKIIRDLSSTMVSSITAVAQELQT